MKKEEVRIGMTVMHNVHGGIGEVVEVKGNKAGLRIGCFIHEVNVNDLVLKAQSASEVKSDTRHQIEIGYDVATMSLFITIDKKETICIANVSPNVLNDIGVSSKSDEDEFNAEIGRALAFYRANM